MLTIWDLPITEESAFEFLVRRRILTDERLCRNGHQMQLNIEDKRFRCNKKTCDLKSSIRSGTWLDGTRKDLVTIIRFFYLWAIEKNDIEFCEQQLKISKETVIAWNASMREICVNSLADKDKKIGGERKIVEIDESLFTKRKNHAGRILPPQWIFGGVCRETKEGFAVRVPNRNALTLMNEIRNHIAEGTTIFSDSWKSYKTEELESAGFCHFKVNHRYNFLNPYDPNINTQTVERLWGSLKWRNKRYRGTARHHLDSYLTEFSWRQQFDKQNVFDEILEEIAKQFEPLKQVM